MSDRTGKVSMPAGDKEFPWLKSYHPETQWELTDEPFPVHELIDKARSKFANNTYMHFLGKDFSYAEIADLADRAAKGLQELGVKKGVHVGLMFPNTPAYLIFYYAILKAGGTVVNYNPLYTVPELEYQVSDSQTEILITHDLKLMFDSVEALLEKGVLKKAVVVPFTEFLSPLKATLFPLLRGKDIAKVKKSPQFGKVSLYKDVLNNKGDYTRYETNLYKDIATIQYTGGTTGRPKGAMLSHANLSYNVNQVLHWNKVDIKEGEEKIVTIIPFFHVFGMTGILLYGTAIGAELLLVPKFEVEDTAKLIHKKRPTVMPGVPTIFIAFINFPKIHKYDLTCLENCVSGGAPLPLEVHRDFTKLANCTFTEGYGLSETSPGAVSLPRDGLRDGSIGVPISGTEISIRSLENPEQEMPLGERGEICIKGPQVMLGYWNKPEATAEVMLGDFFRTGDVGYMDDDGYIYIVDRIKDLIICSGFNVYPRVIEEAVYEHPAVAEVIVIGIPNEYRGEAPKAYIKLREGESMTEEEMLEFLKSRISKIEMPEEIAFRDELPKTMIGKLSKKDLRDEEDL